jgi:hypothetical protein
MNLTGRASWRHASLPKTHPTPPEESQSSRFGTLAIASCIIHYLGWQAARGFGGTCPELAFSRQLDGIAQIPVGAAIPRLGIGGALAPVLAKANVFSVTLRSRSLLRRASVELVRTSGPRSLTIRRIVCRGWSPHLDNL